MIPCTLDRGRKVVPQMLTLLSLQRTASSSSFTLVVAGRQDTGKDLEPDNCAQDGRANDEESAQHPPIQQGLFSQAMGTQMAQQYLLHRLHRRCRTLHGSVSLRSNRASAAIHVTGPSRYTPRPSPE